MAEFPALPVWTDAYLADTTHLTTLQHGAFLLLLFAMWRSKECSLPDDDTFLARVTRLTAAQWGRVRPVLAPMNCVENGSWSNNRLRDELNVVRRQRNQKVIAGKASALKRLNRGSTFVETPLIGCSAPTPTPSLNRKNRAGRARPSVNGVDALPLTPERVEELTDRTDKIMRRGKYTEKYD